MLSLSGMHASFSSYLLSICFYACFFSSITLRSIHFPLR